MKKLILPFKSLWLLISLVFMFSASCFAADTSGNKSEDSVAMQRVLFPDGMKSISPHNIRQGQFNDSELIAVISSLANTQSGRELIMSYFSYDYEQHVTVTFPASTKSFDVAIADIKNNKSYSSTLDGGLWTAVIEKAIALHMGFRDSPDFYSDHDDFIDRVFGHTSDDSYYLSRTSGTYVMGLLTNSHISKIITNKISLKNLHEKLAAYATHGKIVAANSSCVSNHDKGEVTEIIRSCRAYSILGYDPDKKRVTLRDPYGKGAMLDIHTGEPLGEADDGQFSLDLKEFTEYFNFIYFVKSDKQVNLIWRFQVVISVIG